MACQLRLKLFDENVEVLVMRIICKDKTFAAQKKNVKVKCLRRKFLKKNDTKLQKFLASKVWKKIKVLLKWQQQYWKSVTEADALGLSYFRNAGNVNKAPLDQSTRTRHSLWHSTLWGAYVCIACIYTYMHMYLEVYRFSIQTYDRHCLLLFNGGLNPCLICIYLRLNFNWIYDGTLNCLPLCQYPQPGPHCLSAIVGQSNQIIYTLPCIVYAIVYLWGHWLHGLAWVQL